MIKGMRKALLFEVSESPSRGYWKQFLLSHPYEQSQYLPMVKGDNLPRGKVFPPQPLCMLSFLCNDKRDWKEPGHLKFLNALQGDTGNNFSYLISMNTVRIYLWQRGDTLPRGKVPPPSPINPNVCFHFYVMIKGMRRTWLFEVSESPSRGYWK